MFAIPTTAGHTPPGRIGDDALHELVRYAVDSAYDSVIIHRASGSLVYFNDAAAAMFGISNDEMAEMPAWGWISAPPVGRERRMTTILEDGNAQFTAEGRRPDGTTVVVEVNSQVIDTSEGEMIVSVSRDITERTTAEALLRDMAFHDPLTGLANRTLLDDKLKTALSAAERHDDLVGVLYIDLDDFKPVNDTYGHEIGDRVLEIVAERMCSAVRAEDTVARVGGDEFVIVLARLAHPDDLVHAAEKISRVISAEIQIDQLVTGPKVTASIGYALYDADVDDAHSLLIRADLAMYRGRQAGLSVASGTVLG
ncbi:MAG: sensor domain-containing diguanylate cyclase [Actinomycetota bacterium]|jgi:diguanylate cyclase (GGDEF)-like protein/PAS domain S-box-containing protein|nr:sensor domain-containing diguanylate cyclase [Actinomycetota bacterium]